MDEKDEALVEINAAINQTRVAMALISDAKLSMIRADRKLGPVNVSNNLSSHIKQLEAIMKNHRDCIEFMDATMVVLRGDNFDVDVVEGR